MFGGCERCFEVVCFLLADGRRRGTVGRIQGEHRSDSGGECGSRGGDHVGGGGRARHDHQQVGFEVNAFSFHTRVYCLLPLVRRRFKWKDYAKDNFLKGHTDQWTKDALKTPLLFKKHDIDRIVRTCHIFNLFFFVYSLYM